MLSDSEEEVHGAVGGMGKAAVSVKNGRQETWRGACADSEEESTGPMKGKFLDPGLERRGRQELWRGGMMETEEGLFVTGGGDWKGGAVERKGRQELWRGAVMETEEGTFVTGGGDARVGVVERKGRQEAWRVHEGWREGKTSDAEEESLGLAGWSPKGVGGEKKRRLESSHSNLFLSLMQSCVNTPIRKSHVYGSSGNEDEDLTQINVSQEKHNVKNSTTNKVQGRPKKWQEEGNVGVKVVNSVGSKNPCSETVVLKEKEHQRNKVFNHQNLHQEDPTVLQVKHKMQKVGLNTLSQTPKGKEKRNCQVAHNIPVTNLTATPSTGEEFFGSTEFDTKRYGAPFPHQKPKKITTKTKNTTKVTATTTPLRKKKRSSSENSSDEHEVPANTSKNDGAKRNTRFSRNENIALVESIVPVFDKLLGSRMSSTDSQWRTTTWEKITEAVNSVSVHKRTVQNVKKRYQDIKGDVRKKISKQNTESKKTGGLGCKVYFKEYEEKLSGVIDQDSIVGIEEKFDASDKTNGKKTTTVPSQTLMSYSEKGESSDGCELTNIVMEHSSNLPEQLITLEPAMDVNNSCTGEEVVVQLDLVNVELQDGEALGDQMNTSTGSLATNSTRVSSRNARSICRTRNMDREQFLFDKQQSEKLHDAHMEHHHNLMLRLEAIEAQLAIQTELFREYFTFNRNYRERKLQQKEAKTTPKKGHKDPCSNSIDKEI